VNRPRPLPRTLAPLADESLPGYLLRLAHRLDLTPSRVITIVGLQSNTAVARRAAIVSLTEAAARDFAWTTRLTASEVAQLPLIALADRYPPLRPDFLGRNGNLRAMVTETWLFLQATRYCPECLVGDGSLIQQRHGGAWKRIWRLPVTFCCLTHQRLLDHLCPQCRAPAQSNPRYAAGHRLIALTALHLHPTQCRAPLLPSITTNARIGTRLDACGFRFDEPHRTKSFADPETMRQLFSTQEHLANLLSPDGPSMTTSCGMSAEAPGYFVDLRLLTELVSVSWPAASVFAPTTSIADIVDRAVDKLRREQIVVTQSNGSLRIYRALAHRRPPLDALESGALITIAARILAIDNPAEVETIFQNLFQHDTTQNQQNSENLWRRSFLKALDHCTPGLRAAVSGYAQTQHPRRSGRPRQNGR
jgi:hypothetical protein